MHPKVFVCPHMFYTYVRMNGRMSLRPYMCVQVSKGVHVSVFCRMTSAGICMYCRHMYVCAGTCMYAGTYLRTLVLTNVFDIRANACVHAFICFISAILYK